MSRRPSLPSHNLDYSVSHMYDFARYGDDPMTDDRWMEKHLERRIDQAERRTDQVNKRIDRLTEDLMWGVLWIVVMAVVVASAAAS